ncbi:hypothetical protein [Streptomyces sp. NBRC 109706]|uniref:hypothetical protein n=1 Tax=Streptomyces sp. NBRC 109706 TaxID=1550035 RepID=UPI000783BA73|nr:hypothetical protein [Streptomyces sp. NBRC 109706]
MTTATRPLPPHGTTRRYERGCRCDACRRQRGADVKRARYLRSIGRPLTVPAKDARRHLDALHAAGMSDQAIIDAAGVSPDTLYGLTQGRSTVRRTTHDAILAVQPPPAAMRNNQRTDGTGTRRRLRALIAAGWPRAAIAREMGAHKEWVQYLVKTERPVTTWTAYRVSLAYEALAARQPEDNGVQPIRARAAREEALAAGWPDPLFWEDWGEIDNPEAPEREPEERRTIRSEAAYKAGEVRHLAACGLTTKEIADRVSYSTGYVEQLLARGSA